MCGSVADIQSAMAEIRRGKKKKDRRRNHRAKNQKYRPALLHRADIKSNEETKNNTRMWANAEPYGRPAEYR